MFEFRIFVQFYLALSTSNIHSIMEKNFDRSSVCCCCWEYFGLRSKHLTLVNSAIGKTVQTFIYPGYLVDVCSYPSMVCSGCRRNLNLLKAGKQSRGAWGEKVAKVETFCLIKVVTFLNPIKELITRQKSLVFKVLNLCTTTFLFKF